MILVIFGMFGILVGGIIAFLNVALPIQNKLRKNENRFSLVPVVGGLLLLFGLLCVSGFQFRAVYLLALLADLGCAPLMVAVIVSMLFDKHRA